MIAMMSATTKMILAMPAALAAIPKNPNSPAISAMMKKVIAQPNMAYSYALTHERSSGHATLGARASARDERGSTMDDSHGWSRVGRNAPPARSAPDQSRSLRTIS